MPIRRDSQGRFAGGSGTGGRQQAGKPKKPRSAFMEDARAAARKSNAAFASSPEGIRRQQAFKEIAAASKARPAYKGPRTAEDVRNASNWRIRRDRRRAGKSPEPIAPTKIRRRK